MGDDTLIAEIFDAIDAGDYARANALSLQRLAWGITVVADHLENCAIELDEIEQSLRVMAGREPI